MPNGWMCKKGLNPVTIWKFMAISKSGDQLVRAATEEIRDGSNVRNGPADSKTAEVVSAEKK